MKNDDVAHECLITIAIPTYNNANSILGAIDSCLGQSDLHDCEVLVVNNASTDGSDKLIEAYISNSSLRFVNNEKTVSMFENHNICLMHAKGRYVLFCHSDDTLDIDAIAILKAHLKSRSYPKRYVCWGHSLFRDYSSQLSLHGYRTGQLFSGEQAAKPFLAFGLTPSGTCYSRDILDFGGFVASNHRLAPSDSSTMVYLALKGFRFEMYQQLIFFRTAASTAVPDTRPEDALDAYCDTYRSLMRRIDRDELRKLINLARSFGFIPYSFLFFAAEYEPDMVAKIIVRLSIRTPWSIKNKIFWLIILKLRQNRQCS